MARILLLINQPAAGGYLEYLSRDKIITECIAIFGVGFIDNVLRPILVSKDTKLPDYVILVSTIGGLAVIGINGFVIGPVIAALFLTAWQLLATEHRRGDAP